MATYVVLGNFTDQGIRTVKDTTKRADTFKDLAKSFGVTMKGIYWTLGQYDTFAIIDAPDEMAVTAFGLAFDRAGNPPHADSQSVLAGGDGRDPDQGHID